MGVTSAHNQRIDYLSKSRQMLPFSMRFSFLILQIEFQPRCGIGNVPSELLVRFKAQSCSIYS